MGISTPRATHTKTCEREGSLEPAHPFGSLRDFIHVYVFHGWTWDQSSANTREGCGVRRGVLGPLNLMPLILGRLVLGLTVRRWRGRGAGVVCSPWAVVHHTLRASLLLQPLVRERRVVRCAGTKAPPVSWKPGISCAQRKLLPESEKFPRHGKVSTVPLHGCAVSLCQNLKSFHGTARFPVLRMALEIARILHFPRFSHILMQIPEKFPLCNFMAARLDFARISKVSTTRQSFHCATSWQICVFCRSCEKFPRHRFPGHGGGRYALGNAKSTRQVTRQVTR